MRPRTPPPRNAVTSLSLTPYRLKTASVPTSARIYSAVPLKQDLTNELEDATIVEPDSKNPKHHYILYPYESLPPHQTTAPDPSTIVQDDRPLYHTASKSWDPAHLPHILRKPTSDFKEPGPKQRGHVVPTKQRRRGLTVTRKYHGVEGSIVTETQDGTYLPKAGSEEQKVVAWLNHIMAYIRAYSSDSQPTDPDAGPSSRTRGRAARLEQMQRRWSAESSTRLQRVEDTDLQLKPDISLLQPDEYDEAFSGFSWRNLASFLELTSDDYSLRLQLQLTKLAYAIFIAQPGRRFVIALSIANQLLRLHVFDRAGAVHSRGYNIHRYPSFLVWVLYVLTTGPPECLGYDPTLSFSTTISRMKRLRAKPFIIVNGKKYIIQDLLFHNPMIRGRATLCFVVIDPADGKRYVVKDCWTRIGRTRTEEDMLMRMKEKGLTYGVPVLEAAWTVQVQGKDDSTDLRRPSYLFENGALPPETRIRRRLLLSSVGVPLTRFSCKQELISVLIDIVDVHEQLILLCCILHRDISINNILMYFFEGTWPLPVRAVESDESEEHAKLSQREDIIRQRRFRRGLLIDFDYAKFTDRTTSVSASDRTGTVPFMSIDILGEYAMSEGKILHQPKHDLEALVYVLVWICVLYGDPRVGNGPRDASTTCLSAWTSPKTLKEVRNLGVFKRGDLSARVALREFTDYFKDLEDTVGSLYDALVQSYSDGGPELSHASIKKILLDAFFAVQEPNVQNTKRFEAGVKRRREGDEIQTTKQRRLN